MDARYDEWADGRRDNGLYGESKPPQGHELYPPHGDRPQDQQMRYDDPRRGWNDDEDDDEEGMDEGSVYSQDKPPSRESHVR
jgi:hypothetical protein